ncbi:MAG: hypothetical protein M1832_004205 [Thelocarpon impressellum]|nr:MAG: hypothetical protein M1832_004205 [Thelocarpon impressellum]
MAEYSTEPGMLNMLAEKTVHQPILPDRLRYCPTMDLIAVATEEERVFIYRLNGQRVLGLSNNKKEALAVRGLSWKPDGQLLAVAWSDNAVRLINADSSKVVHQIDTAAEDSSTLTCLGWAVNFTNSREVRARIDASEVTLDDILGRVAQEQALGTVPDLPRELALLDIESALPKLSVLPSAGKEEDVFSSRATIDAMFHPLKKKGNDSVDVLVAGFDNGVIHLSIYDSFDIGSLDMGKAYAKLRTCKPSTQLQNVLRYIGQVQRLIQAEWKASQDLPAKFLRNINETLVRECDCDFINAAFHLVVTGDCFGPMKEWLVDELSERGHKRWDKAITAGYESVRRLTHENLLPALERCGLVAADISSADDPSEKDPIIDHPKVLDYIQGAMTKSKLAGFFPLRLATNSAEAGLAPDPLSLYDGVKKALGKYDSGRPMDARMPGLDALSEYLERRLYVFRVRLVVENGVSSPRGLDIALLGLGDGEVVDAKFADDQSLMIIWSYDEEYHLLKIPYRCGSDAPNALSYAPSTGDPLFNTAAQDAFQSPAAMQLSAQDVVNRYSCLAFAADSFRPARLEVNGRKGRRVVCLLGEDGLHYKVFDLDSHPTEAGEPEGDGDGDQEMSQ